MAVVKHFLLMIAVVMGYSVLMADKKDSTQSAIIDRAIRSVLNKPKGEFAQADLEKVREINLDVSSADRFRAGARMKEAGLKELTKLTRLESLRLHGNQLTDVSPLARFPRLNLLHLGNNRLTDVSPLSQLGQLKTLYLSFNHFKFNF